MGTKQGAVLHNLVEVRTTEPKTAEEKVCPECGSPSYSATGKDFESSPSTGQRRVYEVKCENCGHTWYE